LAVSTACSFSKLYPGRERSKEPAVVSLAIACFLIGTLLGLRFRVLILVPTTLIGSLLVVGIAISSGSSAWRAVVVALMAATSLQIGYLGGAATSLLVTASELRAARRVDPRSAL
jgi:hydrogenase/urease accessory protein HupE